MASDDHDRTACGHRYCDLVMRGGVTSGAAYPAAVHELKNTYCFRNIGGASVGAVAAVAAAAAEHRRASDGSTAGFDELMVLSDALQAPGTFLRLFQPVEQVADIFVMLIDIQRRLYADRVARDGSGWPFGASPRDTTRPPGSTADRDDSRGGVVGRVRTRLQDSFAVERRTIADKVQVILRVLIGGLGRWPALGAIGTIATALVAAALVGARLLPDGLLPSLALGAALIGLVASVQSLPLSRTVGRSVLVVVIGAGLVFVPRWMSGSPFLAGGWWRALAFVIIVVLAATIASAVALACGLILRIRRLNRQLPVHDFGLCTGMRIADDRQRAEYLRLAHRWSRMRSTGGAAGSGASAVDDPRGLTEWLHDHIEAIAGTRRVHGSGEAEPVPLTFADLARADLGHRASGANGNAEPGIRLRLMTSDISLGRPVPFPLTDATVAPYTTPVGRLAHGQIYYFDVADFARVFPADVVSFLVRDDVSSAFAAAAHVDRRAGVERSASDEAPAATPPAVGGPADPRTLPGSRLPVIVAARMSMGFPLLLSAVPLWTHRNGTWMRHYISDGGISSNFPVHLFDSWLPRWPTFALTFVQASDAHPDRPRTPRPTTAPPSPVPATTTDTRSFVTAIVNTMQNWRDTLQSELPGFRDRIEPIELAPGQGGLNLNMEPDDIADLRDKGRRAAAALTDGFHWEIHRLRRFQSTMRLLTGHLGPDGFARGYRQAFDRVLADDLRAVREELDAHGLDERDIEQIMKELGMGLGHAWPGAAAERVDRLLENVEEWRIFLAEPPPVPEATLRMGPDV